MFKHTSAAMWEFPTQENPISYYGSIIMFKHTSATMWEFPTQENPIFITSQRAKMEFPVGMQNG